MLERFLWHIFQYAEAYTFLLSWIAIPLGFYAVLGFIRTHSIAVPPTVVQKMPEPEVEKVPEPEAQPQLPEATPNKNVANA